VDDDDDDDDDVAADAGCFGDMDTSGGAADADGGDERVAVGWTAARAATLCDLSAAVPITNGDAASRLAAAAADTVDNGACDRDGSMPCDDDDGDDDEDDEDDDEKEVGTQFELFCLRVAVARNAALSNGLGAAVVGVGAEKKSANGGGDDFGGGGDGLCLLVGKTEGDDDETDDDDGESSADTGDTSDADAAKVDADSNERCPLKSEASRGCFSPESLRGKDAADDEDDGDEDGGEDRRVLLLCIARMCVSSGSIKITSSSSPSS
jgi:hypothetical protein